MREEREKNERSSGTRRQSVAERKTRKEKGGEERRRLKGCNEGWIEERITEDER